MTLVCTATPISAAKPSIEETLKLVPRQPQRQKAAHGLGHQHAEEDDDREFHVAVEREQDQQNQQHGQRDDHLHLAMRSQIVLVLAAPIEAVADRKLDGLVHLRSALRPRRWPGRDLQR